MDRQEHEAIVVAELIERIGHNPAVTLEQVEAQLGSVYVDAEERGQQQTMALVADVWARIQAIYNATEGAISIAAAARQAHEEMMAQRDRAIADHEELIDAMWEFDTSHPMVEHVASAAEELLLDRMAYGSGFYSDCVATDITKLSGIDVTEDEAETFANCLLRAQLGLIADAEKRDELREMLAAFISEFVSLYGRIMREQWEAGWKR